MFTRLADANVKVNAEKCQWFEDRCVYLGHELSAEGLNPKREKSKAIADAPTPKNVDVLKAWLGISIGISFQICQMFFIH